MKKDKKIQAIVNAIIKKSRFYKTQTNAYYIVYRPMLHLGALPLDKAAINKITFTITQSPCSGPQREAVLHLVMKEAEEKAKHQDVFSRIGFADNAVYLDLGKNGVVQVTAAEIRILRASPIPLLRSPNMKDLPVPKLGGEDAPSSVLKKLYRLINVKKSDRKLVISWLLAAFLRKGAMPILLLEGAEGTAKSTTLDTLIRILDWRVPPTIGLPTNEKDLFIYVFNRGIAAFDNVSVIHPKISDRLCQISTGGAISSRKLYTDGDEYAIYVRSLMALNGISTGAVRSDLLDRTLRIEAPILLSEKKKLVTEIETEFLLLHPHVLGALLKIVQHGLKNDAQLPSHLRDSRLVDFSEWVYRCAPALGYDPEKLVKAIYTNQKELKLNTLNTDSVAEVILELIENGGGLWTGRSTELFQAFNEIADSKDVRANARPSSARDLTGWLKRAEPSLLTAGVTVATKNSNRGNILTLKNS